MKKYLTAQEVKNLMEKAYGSEVCINKNTGEFVILPIGTSPNLEEEIPPSKDLIFVGIGNEANLFEGIDCFSPFSLVKGRIKNIPDALFEKKDIPKNLLLKVISLIEALVEKAEDEDSEFSCEELKDIFNPYLDLRALANLEIFLWIVNDIEILHKDVIKKIPDVKDEELIEYINRYVLKEN